MAKAGTLALWGVSVATLVGIAYVHYGQKVERANMHKGVLRDEQMYQLKKRELQQQ